MREEMQNENPSRATASLLRTAVALLKRRDFAAAIAVLTRAISAETSNIELYDRRALARLNMGALEEALCDAEKMVLLDPANPKGYLIAGKAFLMMGKEEHAHRIYKIASRKVPPSNPRYQDISKMYRGLPRSIFNLVSVVSPREPIQKFPEDQAISAKRSRHSSMDRTNLRPPGKNPKGTLEFKDLPVEIFNAVCAYLPLRILVRCTGVCKGWRTGIHSNKLLWTDLDFNAGGRRVTNHAMHLLVTIAGTLLKKLVLRNCPAITNFGLKEIAKQQYGSLLRFELSGNSQVSGATFATICKSMGPSLVKLSLTSTKADDATVQCILECCRSLRHLDLAHCSNVTDIGFERFANSKTKQRFSLILESVNLTGCRVSDRTSSVLAASCPALRSLQVISCQAITKRTVVNLSNCHNLEHLGLTGSDMRQPAGITLDDALLALSEGCPSLSSFSLSSCPQITDIGISYLAGFCAELQEIHLTQCAHIGDSALISLGKSCRALRIALFGTCQKITDEGVVALVEGQLTLHRLDISNNPNVSDKTVRVLARRGVAMTDINLSYCIRITGSAVYDLSFKEGKPLEILKIDNCARIHSDTVSLLRKAIPTARISASFR
ncbi:hypothetical protein DFJ77DRAFT_437200 [Powellomyces hirtus]|nr:hypothetical protein DFJ77DRAFT_437200 [Powellomyces hirtus]